MKTILFICTHNSARSQMAEGLVNALLGGYKAYSAGTEVTKVNPFAIEAMKDMDIDISNHYSKSIEEFRGTIFDYVVTVCDNAKEKCPFFPGKKYIHKSFEDPSLKEGSYEEKLEYFIKIRNQIKNWIEKEFI